jgi:thiol-disulfide isomerase/thioredoxin
VRIAALLAALLSSAPGVGAADQADPIRAATVATILAEARAQPAPALLINVWATWCDPCREELPDVLRFYRDHRGDGLRLVLLSADDDDARAAITAALAEAKSKAGIVGPLDARLYLKAEDDMKLIDGLDPRWSGALPATFLLDRDGRRVQSWLAPISYAELERTVGPRLTKGRAEANTKSAPRAGGGATEQKPGQTSQPRRRKP